MAVTPAEIATHTDGAVSCGATLWRFRGCLQVTVVVKAVFAIVPDGVATRLGPGEIVAEERLFGGSARASVEAAGDLAPFLVRCDVLFAGQAHVLGPPIAADSVRLRLSRYGRWVLDKTIHVYGDRDAAGAPMPFSRMPIVYERAVGGPGSANPVGTRTPNLADPIDARRPAGFGPISSRWPARRLLLAPLDPRSIEGPVPDIPEVMQAEYFQAAPEDQQIEPLRGGEWLVLEGLSPTRRRVETSLPTVHGAARIIARRPGVPESESPVELVCDTLAVDGDRQTVTLTWRGRCALPEGEGVLPSLVVLAALEAPGTPVEWGALRPAPAPVVPVVQAAPVAQAVAERPRSALPPRQSTVVLPPSPSASKPKAALPFTFAAADDEPTRPAFELPRPPSPGRQSAATMQASELAAARAQSALPFAPSGAIANPPSTQGTPWGTEKLRPAPTAAPRGGPMVMPTSTSFGLGMRLSSAPLSAPPPPRREPTTLVEEGDEEIDTVHPSVPSVRPMPPQRVSAPWLDAPSEPARVSSPPPPPLMVAPPLNVEEPEPAPAPPLMVAPPQVASEPPPPRPPVAVPAPAEPSPPPPRARSHAAPPDPWAQPFEPSPDRSPPPAPPATTFERPAAAAVKGNFYSKFARK